MSIWQRLRSFLKRLGVGGLIIGLLTGVFFAAIFASAFPGWTGFGADPLPPNATATPVILYQQEKTLWDWLQLLLVPLVLAVGGFFLTRYESRYALQIQERREKEARAVETERAQDATLQAYLDYMTELLLHENLRKSQEDDEVRSVARARTLTVLGILDGERKGTLIQFLYEANLIGKKVFESEGTPRQINTIISLSKANLKAVNLSGVVLIGANLIGANLTDANLTKAILSGADLSAADLSRAELSEAILLRTTLVGAVLEGANLQSARLKEANLDGSILPGADLREANLTGAKLQDTDLQEANLIEAKLEGASLQEADLRKSNITPKQLVQAASIEGAVLPPELEQTPLASKAKL